MANAIETRPNGVASSSKLPATSTEASSSATTLLRALKSAQSSHAERISTARQALAENKIPRAAELVRQWILDEWLVPSKDSSTTPSVIQPAYHDLYTSTNGPSASPPFAVLVRCLAELEKHHTQISVAPVASLRDMISTHVQTSTYARWVELWTSTVDWLAGDGVVHVDTAVGDVDAAKDLSDSVFQHIMESTDIVQAETSSVSTLVKSIPHLADLFSRQRALAEHLTTSFAEILRSLTPDSLDQFLLPTLSAHHSTIAHYLPILLRALADTRSRSRYTIFTQPTSSKVAYETHISQSLHEALFRDFSQAMAYLDGIALLGGVGAEVVWEARYGCWDEIRRLDVRIEGIERWSGLVVEASRGARAVLHGGDDGAVRVCLKLLACLSVLDYSAAGMSDSVVQLALQSTYSNTAESTELLLVLLHHHRLIRAPVAYVELLCRCISTSSADLSASGTSGSISSALITAITDLITHSGDSIACWRIFVQTSEAMLAQSAEESLLLFANLLAALVVAGCPSEIQVQLKDVWAMKVEDLPVKAKGKSKGKSKSAGGDLRLSAVLTVQSALKGDAGEDMISALKAALSDRTPLETLDLAMCRFLLATGTETMSDSAFIDEVLHRLSGKTIHSYWSLLKTSVLRRIETLASEAQLETLSKAMIVNASASRYVWTASSFWELPRSSAVLLRLVLQEKSSDPRIGLAIPHALQTPDLAIEFIEKAGTAGCDVETIRTWLEQVNIEALSTLPVGILSTTVMIPGRRELGRVIVARLIHTSGAKFPDALVQLAQALREQAQAAKPKLDTCSAVMNIVCLLTSRKWALLPAQTQADVLQISAVCSKVLTKALTKSPSVAIEAKGRLWLDLHTFSAWAGENTKLAVFPDHLVTSLLSSMSTTDPTLILRLVAARRETTDTLIAIFAYLRTIAKAHIVDEAMSSIILNASPSEYSLLWQSARHPSVGGALLALLVSTTREGSGKVVRGHLGPILAMVQGGDSEVLCSLWRHRAILFDEGRAIDAWVTFSGIFLSSPSSGTACSLLDAATSFSQQRSDLLPGTSSAITTAICSIFSYLRGRTDNALAQRIARFLDSLGRSAGGGGNATGQKRKMDDNSNRRQTLTRAMARHVPVILIAYARGATDPIRSITAASRRVVDPSLAELCMSTDAATGKAFDSTGLPYGLGEGLAGEAESAVWAQIWRSWKKERYTGQG